MNLNSNTYTQQGRLEQGLRPVDSVLKKADEIHNLKLARRCLAYLGITTRLLKLFYSICILKHP